MKTVSRRRVFQSFALAGSYCGVAEGQEPVPEVSALRTLASAHGVELSDARLRVIQPVLGQRKAQMKALREFEINDSIEPTQGII